MADELTPQEQRELDAIDRALSGRSVDPEFEDIAALTNELREARATPTPEYADQLDRQAAAWLGAERKTRRGAFGWLRVGLPVAAVGAAAVVAIVVVGGSGGSDPTLELSAVQKEQRGSALAAPESAPAPTDDSAGGGGAGGALEDVGPVFSIEGLSVGYTVFSTTEARVKLGDQEETISLDPGTGTIEISTDGYESGEYTLEVSIGGETQTSTVEVD
jgi:hypothetical protein